MKMMEKIAEVRTAIRMPKDQVNQIAGYNYRNAEQMLTIIKPICSGIGLTLWFSDEVLNVGTHNYIKTKLLVADIETGETMSTEAVAREDDAQTMPSSAMISGASSSYAHKYALQSMFAIDDGSMDPDAWNGIGIQVSTAQTPMQTTSDQTANIPMPVMSEQAVSMQEVPAPVVPEQGVSMQEVPAPVVPEQGVSMQEVPAPVVPEQGVSTQEIPAPVVPEQEVSMQEIPSPIVPEQAVYTVPQPEPMNGQAYGSFPGYAPEPVFGQAPDIPDFGTFGSEPVFPWEEPVTNVPEVEVQEIPAAPLPTMEIPVAEPTKQEDPAVQKPPVAQNGAKGERRLDVYSVSYDIPLSRARILTDAGMIYYKAFDRETPWACEDPKMDLSEIDLDALYNDASGKAGSPLNEYAGFTIP